MTNAERIAIMMAENPNSVLIHTVPSTPFWLVMYKTKESMPNWRCVMCNPEQTTWRVVAENLTDAEYDNLWKAILKIRTGDRMKHLVQALKKET